MIGFALAFLPWIGRNMITLNMSTDNRLMTGSLHHGMYPDFMYDGVPESRGYPYRHDPHSEEIGKNISSVLKEIEICDNIFYVIVVFGKK